MDLVNPDLKVLDDMHQYICPLYVKFLVEEIDGGDSRNEGEMWHLLYSPQKLSSTARQEFATLLDDYTFTCDASLIDLELLHLLKSVFVTCNATTL